MRMSYAARSGGCARERNLDRSKVTLSDLFPGIEAKSADAAFEYITWLNDERQTSANYELVVTRACVSGGQVSHGGLSKASRRGRGQALSRLADHEGTATHG